MAVSAIAAMALLLPVPVSAADPPERVPLAQVDRPLDREVFGFFRPAYRHYLLEHADFSALTTVAYFSITARASGHLAKVSTSWQSWMGQAMDEIIDRAHAAGTRVVMTIARFSWDAAGREVTNRLLSNPTARHTLAVEIADAVVDREVDGVNIDFEPIPAGQRANFVSFMREMRATLDDAGHGLSLTFDATGHIANYDITSLTAPGAADAVFIMGYPYSGPWSDRAGSVSPLTGTTYDVTDTVRAYLDRTSPDKIILGLPLFGYQWSTVDSSLHSDTRPKSRRYGYPYSVLSARAANIAAANGRQWDAVQKGPWTRWRSRYCGSCPLTWHQLYYEDMQSIGLKYDLINARGLRGAGIWALGYQGDGAELYDLIHDKFDDLAASRPDDGRPSVRSPFDVMLRSGGMRPL